MRKNFRSDISIRENFFDIDQTGERVQSMVPENVRVEYFTPAFPRVRFVCSRNGSIFHNCSLDDNGRTLVCNLPLSRKSLGVGPLLKIVKFSVSDESFPYDLRNREYIASTGIDLWGGPSEAGELESESVLSEVILRYGYSAYRLAVLDGFEGTEEEWLASLIGPQGLSAYQVAVAEGFEGSVSDWLASLTGPQGDSAYQVAVDEGFVGTKAQWLASLIGPQGLSAYQVAVAEGFEGSVSEWLASLVGPEGKSAYQVAVDNGFVGTVEEWLASLVGPQGDSAYQVAVQQGFVGTKDEWLASLVGPEGESAYQVAVDNGFVGTVEEWIASLKGETGNGIESIEQTTESEESGGANIITVTMTDGTSAQFSVRNGGRGLQGPPGASNAKYKEVQTLPTASAETMDYIYLTPSQTAGVYNMSYTEEDGGTYTWRSLGTTAIQLSDIEDAINGLDAAVNGGAVEISPVWEKDGYYLSDAFNPTVNQNSEYAISAPFILKKGQKVIVKTENNSGRGVIARTVDGSAYQRIAYSQNGVTGLQTYEYTALGDDKIVVCVHKRPGNASVSIESEGLTESVLNLDDTVLGSAVVITPITWAITGKYISTAGVPTSSAAYSISNPIVLRKGETLSVSTWGGGICIIAEPIEGSNNYTPLVNAPSANEYREHLYTAEEDITVVFCCHTNARDCAVIIKNAPLNEKVQESAQDVDVLKKTVSGIAETLTYLPSVLTDVYGETGAIRKDVEGGYHCDSYIPVKEGDKIIWTYGTKNDKMALVAYDEHKVESGYWVANVAGSRTITVPSGKAFVRVSFRLELQEGGETVLNRCPLKVNDVEYIINDFTFLRPMLYKVLPKDDEHGKIGKYYPEQMPIIENQLEALWPNRFHFIHTSDNHGRRADYEDVCHFLDYCPAKFLVNTGDLVYYTYNDLPNSSTVAVAQEVTKPVFLVLGNHDVIQAPPSKQAIFDAFIGSLNSHNGTSFDKTYYSLDYTTEGVKCIFLDGYDGFTIEELATMESGTSARGRMSDEQIRWFAAQLQDAITRSLHVVVFLHEKPSDIDRFKNIPDFYDIAGSEKFVDIPFLTDMVDAFMDGATCAFTYRGVDYSFAFTGNGHFIAWLNGHTHADVCGWLVGHERQFSSTVCRPYKEQGTSPAAIYGGSYDGDRLGIHFNYCTIDTMRKTFSVYRVGQQTTVFGTSRVSFTIKYL